MEKKQPKKRIRKPRVEWTQRDLKRLSRMHATHSPSNLAKVTGLPYMLIYNLVHGRVKSISNRHYLTLFGRAAPPREALKVDGAVFRAMVDLWLFLNDGITQADLYRDLYGLVQNRKADHRIFNGKINTVEARLEHIMRHKFLGMGIDDQLLDRWLDEFEDLSRDDWVPYHRIRSVLRFLADELGVSPTSILNQSVARYETGELKRVSRGIYDRAMMLKKNAETALFEKQDHEIEKIREVIVGGKPGYTLYTDVQEELQFLRRYAKKSTKRYLGRGVWTYENQRAKRIADWRAQMIMADCDRFIRQTPGLSLADLPRSRQKRRMRGLLDVLVARTTQLLSRQEGIDFEKHVLRPMQPRDEYNRQYHGFTPFDMASSVLGMKRKAFDLMVAKNCEIFRSVGKYTQRWYLSDLYLKELARNEYFDFISAKYEMMAKRLGRSRKIDACMH